MVAEASILADVWSVSMCTSLVQTPYSRNFATHCFVPPPSCTIAHRQRITVILLILNEAWLSRAANVSSSYAKIVDIPIFVFSRLFQMVFD